METPRIAPPNAAFAARFAGLVETQHASYASLGAGVDQTTGRQVAVRVLRSTRFARDPAAALELRAAVTRGFEVAHRGIASPIDVEVDAAAGSAFVVFDTVPLRTLGDVLHATPDARTKPVALLATLAEALVVARATASVHGTLHPHAVHVGVVGTVERAMILDLELGPFLRVAALDAGVRDAPFFAYASPDLLASPASGGVPRDDVFAIAAMTYEVLAGRRPHLGTTLDALRVERRTEPPDLREPRFGVPLPLATLVMRSLAADPAERPSMRELAAGLHTGTTDLTVREVTKPKPDSATRDATVMVERADLEAALKNARLRKPETEQPRRRLGEGWTLGIAALALAGFMSVATRHDEREDGRLRVTTHPRSIDGGIVPPVRVFVDGRFRGIVDRDERRDIAVPVGAHRVVLRFEDGGVAATREVRVALRTTLDVGVAAIDVPDPVAAFRNVSENRFETRCAGVWRGQLDPGHRPVVATLIAHPEDGACGTLDAGRMGQGPLENCAFDGESLLLAQVTLQRHATFAVRLECKPGGTLTLLQPRAEGDLAREPVDTLDAGSASDASP